MWMKRGVPVKRLLALLPGIVDEQKPGSKGAAQIARLSSSLSLAMPSLLPQLALVKYPWCFVMPAHHVSPGLYLTGACVTTEGQSARAMVAVLLRGNDLVRLLKQEPGLPFWMMRALAAGGEDGEQVAVNEQIATDCRELLACMTVPRWQQPFRPATQLSQLRQRLSELRCETDFVLEGKRGGDVMPWRHWPDCLLPAGYLWLWRQNRHGQLIESQRKSLANPVT
ncbi:hypothetical protein N3553_01065 [Pantoea dispersa]|uniref:hypothetical protein n=1 Tax=Pantoea dispersa TaxID=59814 RepID=UPI0021AED7AF|nr:hypothetical protein [Pantoea dispersa]MCT6588467.1 hypothetical protein [Pantoea dispersa]